MLDNYGRNITYLRLSVTDFCNLRCRYCMPAEGVCPKTHDEMLTEDEMIQAVEAAASLGIHKLRITGGEPLVKRNILSICQRAANVEGIDKICITTNGTLLPKLSRSLKDAGVTHLNLSLDTLQPDRYAHITRCGNLQQALAGLHTALNTEFEKIKINAVLIGGFNDDEIRPMAELTLKYPVDIRFIELMPMQEHDEFNEDAFLPVSVVRKVLPEATACPADGGVAKLYRLPNALGNIGLISPLSEHFCGQCNRIRLTADGKLKPCLHSADEFAIKGLSFEDVRSQLTHTILAKPACHAALSASSRSHAGRTMNQIGG